MASEDPPTPASRWVDSPRTVARLGAFIAASSALYVVTDLIEVAQGGFSPAQLWLTLLAEAAIPPFVLALAVVLGPRLGTAGWVGAGLYAYSYVFFCGTVIYALLKGTPDYAALSDALGPWMLVHGACMVVGGLAFGAAVLRSGMSRRWPALALMAGVVLVAALQKAPEGVQVVAAAVRALGFAGMGAALIQTASAGRPVADTTLVSH